MAQYVSCKGHKPSCQGYRLAEIFSIFVYTPGKPGRGSEDAACAVSGFDSRVSLLTATYGLLKIQPYAACGIFHWTKITITARITAACVGVRTIGVHGMTPFVLGRFCVRQNTSPSGEGYGTTGCMVITISGSSPGCPILFQRDSLDINMASQPLR